MKVFEYLNEFEVWLDENYWFEDGYIDGITTYKNQHEIIDSVKIRIGYQIEGTLKGGTPITLKEYIITASNIKVWTFNDNTIYNPDNCISGVDIIDNCDGIGIEVDVPEVIKLICGSITVEGPFIKKSIRKPWVSERYIFFNIKEGQIPKPSEWIKWLDEMGFNVSWRYGGSEAKLEKGVPYPNYSGWFLQETHKIPTSQYGVLFSNVRFNKREVSISLEKYDDDINELWNAVLIAFVLNVKNMEVLCGNCRFNGNEWLEYLKYNKIPEDMYGWE